MNDMLAIRNETQRVERENKAYEVQELLTNDYFWDDVRIYIGNYIVTISMYSFHHVFNKIIGLREWDLFHPSCIARTLNEEGDDHIMKQMAAEKYCEHDTEITRELYRSILNSTYGIPKNKPNIKKVIFNEPATIVFWDDGTKTVVKAEDEAFDKEKGLAMAISKKFLGNKGNYYNEFKKWVD